MSDPHPSSETHPGEAAAAPITPDAAPLPPATDPAPPAAAEIPPAPAEAPDAVAHVPRTHPAPPPPGSSPVPIIREGDKVLIVGADGKKILVTAQAGSGRGTHQGQIDLGALVGLPFGRAIYSSKGQPFHTLRPNLADLVMGLKRATQIIYPKDIGPILMRLNIGPGSRVIECGSGSGALTLTLAWAVGETGQIYAYDRVGNHLNRNRTNLKSLGMLDRVTHRFADVLETGFEDGPVDAVFLDLKDAHLAIPHAAEALHPGSVLGLMVPTTNQVSYIIDKLEGGPWIDIDIQEFFFRRYKVNKSRFRPFDRMIAHTGYLVFARRIEPLPVPEATVEEAPAEMPVTEGATGAPSEAEGWTDTAPTAPAALGPTGDPNGSQDP